MRQGLALATMAFALLTTTGTATASTAGANTTSDSDIVARGANRPGWITTRGPDAAGQYSVAIDVSGIDPTTAQGWTRMARRVDHGVARLCDMVGARALVTGARDENHESCMTGRLAEARVQMDQARSAAQRGEKVATLGLGYPG